MKFVAVGLLGIERHVARVDQVGQAGRIEQRLRRSAE